MKAKPLNAYWASELAPQPEPEAIHIHSAHVKTLDAAVSQAKARDIERHRLGRSPDASARYPFGAETHPDTDTIREIAYFQRATYAHDGISS